MKEPHLLRVEEGPERFAPLIQAGREAGLRVGWLELAPAVSPPPAPPDLERAAAAGALRAVAVGGGRSLAVKPLRGEPVLKDLLREHFRGCALVLVRGPIAAPLLTGSGEEWHLRTEGEAVRSYSTEALIASLRKPHPWAAAGP